MMMMMTQVLSDTLQVSHVCICHVAHKLAIIHQLSVSRQTMSRAQLWRVVDGRTCPSTD